MEVIVIAMMDNSMDHTFESANRIYGVGGVSPTIPTGCGGGHTPKIYEVKNGKQNSKRLFSKNGQDGVRQDVKKRL